MSGLTIMSISDQDSVRIGISKNPGNENERSILSTALINEFEVDTQVDALIRQLNIARVELKKIF